MKIEMGESLISSWLKHIKECQVVQTNWKASNNWQLKNKETLEQLMHASNDFFSQKYGNKIYKKNRSINQMIRQAEIDVVGINFKEDQNHIYAIDVAFHEAGLNYGSREETVTRIIKKCLRTAMCLYGYFGFNTGTIIFTSPKINFSLEKDLMNHIDSINYVLNGLGLNFKICIIGNNDFEEEILAPVLNILGDVADTSELFVRSLQMYKLFSSNKQKQENAQKFEAVRKNTPNMKMSKPNHNSRYEEMKIGKIVRTELRKKLESGEVSKEEIEKMQTKSYSKETFDIQYPLLQKAKLTQGKSPKRYYANPIKIYGEDYYLCSEWFETEANNDRPYLIKCCH